MSAAQWAVGDGTFTDTRLDGTFRAAESVIFPPTSSPWPGLPVLIPGENTVLPDQSEANGARIEFHAVDAAGTLLSWESIDGLNEQFCWFSTDRTEPVAPVFPVTAWC